VKTHTLFSHSYGLSEPPQLKGIPLFFKKKRKLFLEFKITFQSSFTKQKKKGGAKKPPPSLSFSCVATFLVNSP